MEFVTSPTEIATPVTAAEVIATASASSAAATPAADAPVKVKKPQNPDVRSFTGYIACDGSTHKSAKEAIGHSEQVKIKGALEALATNAATSSTAPAGVSYDERDNRVIFVEDLPTYLFAHRAEIMAAFSQVVKVRAPRGSKKAAEAA